MGDILLSKNDSNFNLHQVVKFYSITQVFFAICLASLSPCLLHSECYILYVDITNY